MTPPIASEDPLVDPTDAETTTLGDIADAAGIRRIHILAWRDLDDVEAGGSEIHADQLARRWAAAGLDVTMRTSHAQGQLPTGTRHGYRVVRRGSRHGVFPDTAFQELFGRLGPRDALLEVWNGVPFFSPVWARGPRATFIHHVHADMWDKVLSPRLAAVGRVLETRIAPVFYRRTRVLTGSESARQEIIDRLGLHPDRVSVAPYGVDPRFRPGGERAPHPLVLTVGRLVPNKRLDALVDALVPVQARVPDLELVIVGTGYERADLEAHVDRVGARNWVRFAGRVEDDTLVELYRQAWLVTSASEAEGWGLTMTEAGACGTPAVATRIPGHVSAVDEGRGGLLADTPAELSEPVTTVLTDADLRERLGKGAREYAADFTWDRSARLVLEALADEAIEARTRRHRRS